MKSLLSIAKILWLLLAAVIIPVGVTAIPAGDSQFSNCLAVQRYGTARVSRRSTRIEDGDDFLQLTDVDHS